MLLRDPVLVFLVINICYEWALLCEHTGAGLVP